MPALHITAAMSEISQYCLSWQSLDERVVDILKFLDPPLRPCKTSAKFHLQGQAGH